MKTAIVLGATGLVGSALVQNLLYSHEYTQVKLFVRRESGMYHPKVIEYIVDFDKPDAWRELVTGDVLFSTLGTTLAVAGSKANQYRVDFSYQYQMAQIAAQNGVPTYVLVSSAGAKAKSFNFYLSMKGQLDDAVQLLPFKQVTILRPGQLFGNRLQKRVTEKWAIKLMFLMNKMGLFQKYRPIHANKVAQAMINVSLHQQSGIYSLESIFEL
jgi:uncharacterized protein YbjT (DUF2867 family)